MSATFDDSLDDALGDTAVATPSQRVLPVAVGAMIILAAIGFYMGLNSGDLGA
jgi:hypothetical protein